MILCPATARHADWTEQVAAFGTHLLVEKPFAASLAEADRMIAAVAEDGQELAINWPLRWSPPHVTAKRLIDEGVIGEVTEVHYYDGNRGPLRHVAGKVEVDEPTPRRKSRELVLQEVRRRRVAAGLPRLRHDAGDVVHGGRAPLEVTAVVDGRPGLEVDEHSVTVARYARG